MDRHLNQIPVCLPARVGLLAASAVVLIAGISGCRNGVPCTTASQCASNHCVDGVCCATACDAVCLACVESLTGAADGTCAPIPEPFDPDGDCLAAGGYGCNGAGACNPEKTWHMAIPVENDFGLGSAASPSIAMDRAGNAIAVWTLRSGPSGTPAIVRANRYVPGDGWGVAETIQVDTTRNAYSPVVDVNAGGDAVVVWRQADETAPDGAWSPSYYEIWARRFIAGSGWQTAELIGDNDTGGTVRPLAAVDDLGNAFAAWEKYDGDRLDLWANRFEIGVGWTGAVLVENSDAGPVLRHSIAASADGEALVGWAQSDGTRYNAWAAGYTPVEGWADPVLLESDDTGNAGDVAVGMNRGGGAVAVWWQSDGTQQDVRASSYNNGAWGPAASIGADLTILQTDVAVAGDGSAVAVWAQLAGSEPWNLGPSIAANHLGSGGVWGSAVTVGESMGYVSMPDVAVDDAGNAVAVWDVQRSRTDFRVVASRGIAAGGWSEPVELTPSDLASGVRVAVSPTGEAVAVWMSIHDIWSAVLR